MKTPRGASQSGLQGGGAVADVEKEGRSPWKIPQ